MRRTGFMLIRRAFTRRSLVPAPPPFAILPPGRRLCPPCGSPPALAGIDKGEDKPPRNQSDQYGYQPVEQARHNGAMSAHKPAITLLRYQFRRLGDDAWFKLAAL